MSASVYLEIRRIPSIPLLCEKSLFGVKILLLENGGMKKYIGVKNIMFKVGIFVTLIALSLMVGAVEMKGEVASFRDRSGDKITVEAVKGQTYCNGGKAAVNLVATDEHVIDYVSICLSHPEVDKLIEALMKAKNQF